MPPSWPYGQLDAYFRMREFSTCLPMLSSKGNVPMTATMLKQAPQETSDVAISGLVELADGHAFVRASGYRRGPGDVYVSAGQIRQYGLRTGDWVGGAARPTSAPEK